MAGFSKGKFFTSGQEHLVNNAEETFYKWQLIREIPKLFSLAKTFYMPYKWYIYGNTVYGTRGLQPFWITLMALGITRNQVEILESGIPVSTYI